MATITCLPDEMILLILENESISIEDLLSFTSTCKRFQLITPNNKFWGKKYYQRCPLAKIKYNTEKRNHLNFEIGIREGMQCIKSLQYYVSLMSHCNLRDTDKKDLEYLLRLTAENSMRYYFVWDELNKISAQLSWQLDSNLTTKYYFGIIIECLKQYRIKYKRDKFINMPMEKQLFEQLFTIMVQYFHPSAFYSVIKTWLDDIAQEVLSRLKNKYPAHSIFSTSIEQFSFWRDNNIDDNFWNLTETTQIMRILEEFIFSDLEDHKLHKLLITLDLNKIFNLHKKNNHKFHIEHKKLISECLRIYVLTTIYHSVARRLGIRCLLMLKHDQRHIKILWKPKYKNTKDVENLEYFFRKYNSHKLYPLNIVRGSYNNRVPCKVLNNTWVTNLMIQNFNKILRHLVCNSNNIYMYYLWESKILQQILIGNNINIMKPIEVKSDILINRLSEREGKKIKFAVGLIVSHLYRSSNIEGLIVTTKRMCYDGVIIAWYYNDQHADEIGFRVEDWKFMFPHLVTPNGDPLITYPYIPDFYRCSPNNRFNVPHYMILTENNKVCLVPEDDISICSPKLINNVEIGRFFCKFDGTHYVPNERLRKAYPNDTAVIPKILSNQQCILL